MSFSAEWLALREPADHSARNRDILDAVSRHFAERPSLTIVDLGCGSGSNLRGMAMALPREQHWHLVDYDPRLLAAARDTLAAWADAARKDGETLVLEKADRRIRVDFVAGDLSSGAGHLLPPRVDLVSAAALFDLMSASWIGRFVRELGQRGLPLYTVLIYDGQDAWTPPHPLDEAINRAFCAHQRTDKGFGPAAGPDAAPAMIAAFEDAGYRVMSGDSPWVLGDGERSLIAELVKGIANAATETGALTPAEAAAWATDRAQARGTIGHRDLFAWRPYPSAARQHPLKHAVAQHHRVPHRCPEMHEQQPGKGKDRELVKTEHPLARRHAPRQIRRDMDRPEQIDRRTAHRRADEAENRHQHDQDIDGDVRETRRLPLPVRQAGRQRRRPEGEADANAQRGQGKHDDAERFVQLVERVLESAVRQAAHDEPDRDHTEDDERDQPVEPFLHGPVMDRLACHRSSPRGDRRSQSNSTSPSLSR